MYKCCTEILYNFLYNFCSETVWNVIHRSCVDAAPDPGGGGSGIREAGGRTQGTLIPSENNPPKPNFTM